MDGLYHKFDKDNEDSPVFTRFRGTVGNVQSIDFMKCQDLIALISDCIWARLGCNTLSFSSRN